jgi:hypothetical protein
MNSKEVKLFIRKHVHLKKINKFKIAIKEARIFCVYWDSDKYYVKNVTPLTFKMVWLQKALNIHNKEKNQ